MKVFLVRHAEGKNFETHWQSPTTPLSEKGIRQAESVAKTNRFKAVDNVYSSPFTRTRQTAQAITDKEIDIKEEIRERGQSLVINNLERTSSVSKDYSQVLAKNTENWNYKWDKDEESKNEVLTRAVSFKTFLTDNCLGKNILAVTHEDFSRVFIAQCIMGDDSSDLGLRKLYKALSIANTGISLLIYNEEQKVWKIGYLNDFSHGI